MEWNEKKKTQTKEICTHKTSCGRAATANDNILYVFGAAKSIHTQSNVKCANSSITETETGYVHEVKRNKEMIKLRNRENVIVFSSFFFVVVVARVRTRIVRRGSQAEWWSEMTCGAHMPMIYSNYALFRIRQKHISMPNRWWHRFYAHKTPIHGEQCEKVGKSLRLITQAVDGKLNIPTKYPKKTEANIDWRFPIESSIAG